MEKKNDGIPVIQLFVVNPCNLRKNVQSNKNAS